MSLTTWQIIRLLINHSPIVYKLHTKHYKMIEKIILQELSHQVCKTGRKNSLREHS